MKIRQCNINDYIENIVKGDDIENNRHRFERMHIICKYYHALKWKNETKGFCCLNGQIVLASLSPTPPNLYKLLTAKDSDSNKSYINNIRAYNQVLAFISLRADVDKNLANTKEGVYTFRI